MDCRQFGVSLRPCCPCTHKTLMTHPAFCAQYRFQDRVIAVTDAFQKMDHFYWTLQAWLMYRLGILSGVCTFLLTVMALYTGVSAGLTAFVLIAARRCKHRVTSSFSHSLTEPTSCQHDPLNLPPVRPTTNGIRVSGAHRRAPAPRPRTLRPS